MHLFSHILTIVNAGEPCPLTIILQAGNTPGGQERINGRRHHRNRQIHPSWGAPSIRLRTFSCRCIFAFKSSASAFNIRSLVPVQITKKSAKSAISRISNNRISSAFFSSNTSAIFRASSSVSRFHLSMIFNLNLLAHSLTLHGRSGYILRPRFSGRS